MEAARKRKQRGEEMRQQRMGKKKEEEGKTRGQKEGEPLKWIKRTSCDAAAEEEDEKEM